MRRRQNNKGDVLDFEAAKRKSLVRRICEEKLPKWHYSQVKDLTPLVDVAGHLYFTDFTETMCGYFTVYDPVKGYARCILKSVVREADTDDLKDYLIKVHAHG